MKNVFARLRAATVVALAGCVVCPQATNAEPSKAMGWRDRLRQELPAYGHRNWIVIADSAYPKQSAPGIETVVTGEDQLTVLEAVLEAIDAAPHVRPLVLVDSELVKIPDADAPGIASYRRSLDGLLSKANLRRLPHEDIIRELDEGSKLFNVLLLKTNMTIPYTSVFIQLDCGYWDAAKESRLRGLEGDHSE